MKFRYCNICKVSSYCVLEDVWRLGVCVPNIYLWPLIMRFYNALWDRDISVLYSFRVSHLMYIHNANSCLQ